MFILYFWRIFQFWDYLSFVCLCLVIGEVSFNLGQFLILEDISMFSIFDYACVFV